MGWASISCLVEVWLSGWALPSVERASRFSYEYVLRVVPIMHIIIYIYICVCVCACIILLLEYAYYELVCYYVLKLNKYSTSRSKI